MKVLREGINQSDAPEAQIDLIDSFFSNRERVLDACTDWRDPCND